MGPFRNLLVSSVVVLTSLFATTQPVEIFVNPVTGNRIPLYPRTGPPTKIYRAKTSMNGYKQIMNVKYSKTQVFDIYNFRMRWAEPFDWNDRGDERNRTYEVHCWVELGDKYRNLFHRDITWWYQGYNEKFRFPQFMDLYTQCRVRAKNSLGMKNNWALTNKLRVRDIPVYIPGLEGINVKGLSREDVASVLEKIANEAGADAKK